MLTSFRHLVLCRGHLDGPYGGKEHHHPMGNWSSRASSSMNDCIVAKGVAQNVNNADVRHSGTMLHLERISNQVCLAFADVPRNIGAMPFFFLL